MEYGDTAGNLYVKSSSQIDSTHWQVGYKYFDNLGRTIRTRAVEAAGDVYTLTCYDNMGRISKVTNPFRGYSTQTCSTTTGLDWTSTTYDAEGRVTAVTTPDTRSGDDCICARYKWQSDRDGCNDHGSGEQVTQERHGCLGAADYGL